MKEDMINKIGTLIKTLKLEKSSFQKKSTDPESAHTKIISKLQDLWDTKYDYFETYSWMGIDFLGKRKNQEGPIELAVEVDQRWWRGLESCIKLANIRAENKIWIYATADEDAEESFESTLKDIQKLLRVREEKKELFGNFAVVLKTPSSKNFKMERIF